MSEEPDLTQYAVLNVNGEDYFPRTAVEMLINEANKLRKSNSTWLPIESAPRDGTDILLYFNLSGNDEQKPIKEVVKGHFYASALWGDCWKCDGEYTVEIRDNVITHWMPLPPPPTKEGV